MRVFPEPYSSRLISHVLHPDHPHAGEIIHDKETQGMVWLAHGRGAVAAIVEKDRLSRRLS